MTFLERLSGSARGRPRTAAAPPNRIELELREQAAERRTRLLERDPLDPAYLPPPPAWIDPANVLGWPEAQGYVPLREAAARMQLAEEEVVDQVERGLLAARAVGRDLYVRPALISVSSVAVVDKR